MSGLDLARSALQSLFSHSWLQEFEEVPNSLGLALLIYKIEVLSPSCEDHCDTMSGLPVWRLAASGAQ